MKPMSIAGNSLSSDYVIKVTILVALCLQNSGFTLLRKYSSVHESVPSHEILLVQEIMKLGFSVYMMMNENAELEGSENTGLKRIMWLTFNSQKMLFLAFLYGIINILGFVSLQFIGAGEFTICAQLKVMSTACFSVAVLGTTLSSTKWRALALLMLGCILVALPSVKPELGRKSGSTTESYQIFGYIAILSEVLLSGFASIYFEKVIKTQAEKVTIWERNYQLGIYSIAFYAGLIMYDEMNNMSNNEQSFIGSKWSIITVFVAIFGASGGLLVAATLKYADSILKTISTSGAIVISTIVGHYLLNGPFDEIMSIGALVTIISIANYTFDTSS